MTQWVPNPEVLAQDSQHIYVKLERPRPKEFLEAVKWVRDHIGPNVGDRWSFFPCGGSLGFQDLFFVFKWPEDRSLAALFKLTWG